MTKSLFSRFIIILSILTFATLLLFPTLGPKTMVVEFDSAVELQRLQEIADVYRADDYDVRFGLKHGGQVVYFQTAEELGQKLPQGLESKTINQADSDNPESLEKYKKIPLLQFHSYRITLALANAIRINPEVSNITIEKTWIEDYLLAKQIKLGLDLQGGMHLLLQADYGDVLNKLIKDKIAEWKKENYEAEKPKPGVDYSEADILVLEAGLSDQQKEARIARWRQENNVQEQADPQAEAAGGVLKPLVLEIEEGVIKEEKKRIITQAREILNKRIDKTGVSEPSIRALGNDSIEIQLPGIPDPKKAKQMIGSTGIVNYKLVNNDASNSILGKITDIPQHPLTKEEYDQLRERTYQLLDKKKSKDGQDLEVIYLFQKNSMDKHIPVRPYIFESEIMLEGGDIDRAWVGSTEDAINAVQFLLTPEGATRFAEITAKNKNRQLGVIIDDQLFSDPPVIRNKIAGGSAVITGDFTRDEAQTIASIINEGALPVKLSIIEERTVGPSLGVESIESGMMSILVALVLVVIIMIIRYKAAGLVAMFGLFANLLVLGALLSWLGFTLTLPGFAGMILTLGMAVDANVIIFERIREELRMGKKPRSAISNGFDKAFSTIFDSNVTTLLAALVLSQLGTGPIKGFAVTLSVGIISSLFTALYITRFIYDVISQRKSLESLSI